MVVNIFLTRGPDFDDKVLHVALLFGGMCLYATLRKIADLLGVDIVNWIKKKLGGILKSDTGS